MEYAVNNTVHATTRLSPSLLLFGAEQRGPIVDEMTEYLETKQMNSYSGNASQMREKASEGIIKSQAYNLKYFNEHHKSPEQFEEGEYVVIKNVDNSVEKNKKLIQKYRGPYMIKQKLGHDRYVVEDLEGFQVTQIPYSNVLDSSRIKRWLDSSKDLNLNHLDLEGSTELVKKENVNN